MKKILIFLILNFNLILLSGQKPISNSSQECSNYNSYLHSDQIDLLRNYTTDIKSTGIITFDGTVMDDVDAVEDLFPLLEIDNHTGFELLDVYQSRLNENHIYRKYQQTYKGIAVEGGGFTTVTYGEFHTGEDPCDKLIALSTYLVNVNSINTTPAISKNSIKEILDQEEEFGGDNRLSLISELLISSIGRDKCEFGLTWKNRYEGGKLTYVDAHTGEILNQQDQFLGLNAPTEIFGTVNLLDTEYSNFQTDLIYSQGNTIVKTHDFQNASLFLSNQGSYVPHDFAEFLIPSTNQQEWTEQEAAKNVYQAHHVVTSCLPGFESLGINFTELNVGANFEGSNAYVLLNPGQMWGNIHFGEMNGLSYALHDVAAHEMAHIYLGNFIIPNTVDKASIHEAYADILATYVEFNVKGGPNWWMGDEVEGIKASVNRNLADPQYSCMHIFNANPGYLPHDRSQPLSHWFYLLSEGFEYYGREYQGVGIEVATDIVLEILYMIGPEGDYVEIKEAASQLLYEHYGVCSDAMTTASAAFNKICMGYFDYPVSPCFFAVSGQDYRCEEWEESYNLCPINAPTGLKYKWTILDSQGLNWTSSNGIQSGNSFTTGPTQPCLYINHIPEYNNYPRQIKISVYPTEYGPAYKQIKRLTLLDCDSSTPDPCDPAIGFNELDIDQNYYQTAVKEDVIKSIKIFDLMGRLLYSGSEKLLDLEQINVTGIIVINYFNQSNEFVKAEKQFINQ